MPEPDSPQRLSDAVPNLCTGYTQVLGPEGYIVTDGGHNYGGLGILLHHAGRTAGCGRALAVEGDGTAC